MTSIRRTRFTTTWLAIAATMTMQIGCASPPDGVTDNAPRTAMASLDSNDDIADARVLEPKAFPYTETFDIEQATAEPGETQNACGQDVEPELFPYPIALEAMSLWWTLTPDEDMRLSVRAPWSETSRFRRYITIYEGDPMVPGNDIACSVRVDRAVADLKAGATYHISVVGFPDSGPGDITFRRADPVVTEPFALTLDDGVVLRGHVHRPVADHPVPLLLRYEAYFGNENKRTTDDLDINHYASFGHLTDEGYAVAFISERGTSASDGCSTMWGSQVTDDLYAVLDELATWPGTSGKIGMVGFSASGGTGTRGAKHPAVGAIVVWSPMIDLWNVQTRNGMALEYGYKRNTAFATAFTSQPLTSDRPTLATFPQRLQDTQIRPCPETTAAHAQSESPYWNGARNDYYEDRDWSGDVIGTTTPLLATFGIQTTRDRHGSEIGPVWEAFAGATGRGRQPARHLILSQHGHAFTNDHTIFDQTIAFLDHHLKGRPNPRLPTVRIQDSDGAWHSGSQWPLAQDALTLHLGDGIASRDADVELSPETLLPGQTIPCLGFCQGVLEAPVLPSLIGAPELACTAGELVHMGPVLEADTRLGGPATAELLVESSAPAGNIAIYVWAVGGDEDPCAPGVVGRQVAMIDGNLHSIGTPLADGRYQLDIPGENTVDVVHAGERLVVSIGSASWGSVAQADRPLITILDGSVTLPVID